MAIKKISVLMLSSLLLVESTFAQYATNVQCTLKSSSPFGLVGDVSGKRVFTEAKYTYDCNETIIKKGTCKTWSKDSQYDTFVPNQNKNVYYQTSNFSGSIGQMLSTINIFSKLNGIWAGWHGYCYKGVQNNNFAWVSNPYFIAGAALDVVSFGVGRYAADAGKAAQAAQKVVAYSVCAANAGINVGMMLQQYNSTNQCDPVDDICPWQQKNNANQPGQVFTLPLTKYNDFINQPGGKQIMKYIQVINQTANIITIRIINPGPGTGLNGSSAAAQAAMKKVKLMMLKLEAAMTTIELGACVASTYAGVSSTHDSTNSGKKNSSSLSSPANLTVMTLGAINPLVGLGAQIAINMYNSFQTVNTCDNLQDAKNAGSRDVATYYATRAGFCHFVRESTKNMGLGTKQERYYYCCYDSKITRILAEQANAQYALGWQHCTSINLPELEHLSFTPCGSGLNSSNNGVNFPSTYTTKQRMQAYQYTHKCMDLTPLDNYIEQKFGGPDHLISQQQINNMLGQYHYQSQGQVQ